MKNSNSSKEIKIFNTEDYGLIRKQVYDILDSNKSEDIVIINLKPHIGYDLYFMIATALSNTHLKKLVTDTMITLKKEGIFPGYVPNDTDYTSGWIALDYGELIVHIFTKEKRDYYNLEDLWKDSIVETF
jgi:ribosome-associated protein